MSLAVVGVITNNLIRTRIYMSLVGDNTNKGQATTPAINAAYMYNLRSSYTNIIIFTSCMGLFDAAGFPTPAVVGIITNN
jgi:hypothetical protein